VRIGLITNRRGMSDIRKRPNGWLRLWVVLSLVWATCLIYPAYHYLWKFAWPKSYVVTNPEGRELTLVFSSEIDEEEVRGLIKSEYLQKFKEHPDLYAGHTVQDPYHAYLKSNLWQRAFLALTIFFVPPILSLALGYGVAWVRRGFSH